MAVGYNSIESGLDKVPLSMDESARSLGISNAKTLRKINLPLIRPAVWTGLLLVFIDVLKELPLTLILRPFNFDTLAIRAFEFASDERIAEAAPASLVLVAIGLLPVILINKLSKFD
jgi:iron(III) transport system permease protein